MEYPVDLFSFCIWRSWNCYSYWGGLRDCSIKTDFCKWWKICPNLIQKRGVQIDQWQFKAKIISLNLKRKREKVQFELEYNYNDFVFPFRDNLFALNQLSTLFSSKIILAIRFWLSWFERKWYVSVSKYQPNPVVIDVLLCIWLWGCSLHLGNTMNAQQPASARRNTKE